MRKPDTEIGPVTAEAGDYATGLPQQRLASALVVIEGADEDGEIGVFAAQRFWLTQEQALQVAMELVRRVAEVMARPATRRHGDSNAMVITAVHAAKIQNVGSSE